MADKATTRTKPQLPLRTRLLLAANSFAADAYRRSNSTISHRLIKLLDAKVPAPSTKFVNGVPVTSSDISVDPSRDLWFRLFVPTTNDSPQKLPLIIYFHGGGFTFFSASSKPYDELCRRIAGELSAVVASVNYRLAPEHRFPSQYDDGFDVLKFLDTQNQAVLPSNADLTRCFIAGDSAGGNIGHHVTFRASQNSHDFKTLKILGLLLLQPFFGGEERTESELRLTGVPLVNLERTDWSWKVFLPESSNRNHEAANVFGSESGLELAEIWQASFPATVVFVGGFDPLQDWQKRYYKRLKERCEKEEEEKVELIEYPSAIHAFYGFPELPENAFLIKDMRDFVQRRSSAK